MTDTLVPQQQRPVPPPETELSGPISSQPTPTGGHENAQPAPKDLGITPVATATPVYTGGPVAAPAAAGGISMALAQTITTAISIGLAQQPTDAAGWAKLADYYSTSAGENQIATAEKTAPPATATLATATTPTATAGSPAPASGGGSNAQWAASVLAHAGLPQSQNNVDNVLRWMTAEEPSSNWSHNNNPLNINAGGSGSDTFANLDAAAAATAAVISQPNMSGIHQALAANTDVHGFSAAVVASPWAASHYGGDPNHLASIPVPGGSGQGAAVVAAPYYHTAAAGAPGSSNNIVQIASAQIGTPYVWGGEDPNAPGHRGAFDCSGLVQWTYGQAGVKLPRVAQAQYDATPKVAANTPLQPGDLLFFGGGPKGIEHVGIYIGNNQMIDAPHTGADVRVEQNPTSWGNFVGATRPVDHTGATTAITGPAAATATQANDQFGTILQQVTQQLSQLSRQYPGMFHTTTQAVAA